MKTALDYAISACETMMRKFASADLPPKGHFHYHQGVFLSGMYETYKLCGDERYFKYIKDWIDSVFDADGKIIDHSPATLDDIMPGILLFPLIDKTGDRYYEKCLQSVMEDVRIIPRNSEGGYWHKPIREDQMWLDGLYMGGPFMSEYAQRYGDADLAREVVFQALMMEQKTKDAETGLMYHAWDGSGKTEWHDPVTGRSAEFWGRAMGWVGVAIMNDLDFLPEDIEGRDAMISEATNLLKSLCRYQSSDGRWYQVVDKVGVPGNWPENSCSCLYTAAMCKAIRRGYLLAEYRENALRGYEGVINSLSWNGDDIQIGNVCVGTGVGNYEHYINRPTSVNDLHGVGAFLLMCTEVQKLIDSKL